MIIRDLSLVDFKDIVDCFNVSFNQYFVKLPTDPLFWKTRWDASKVDYSLSFGMFDQNQLVGFIIHAIDHRAGFKTAYNAGTGVIPSHRGRKIVKSIYEYAIPILRENGVNKSILEVVKNNTKAIKAYEGIGFEICKSYKTYQGKLDAPMVRSIQIDEILDVDFDILPNQQSYSWDFHKNTIVRKAYQHYKVIYKNQWESFFILDKSNGYVAQFDLMQNPKNRDGWNRLFTAINSQVSIIKLNNVDERALEKISFIESINFDNTVDQYEMELLI